MLSFLCRTGFSFVSRRILRQTWGIYYLEVATVELWHNKQDGRYAVRVMRNQEESELVRFEGEQEARVFFEGVEE